MSSTIYIMTSLLDKRDASCAEPALVPKLRVNLMRIHGKNLGSKVDLAELMQMSATGRSRQGK